MTDRWFAEVARSGFEQRIELRARLWAERSQYQQIEILDTVPFGRALVLDGAVQTTEADEFCYHEPLVHVPLLALDPPPRRVLIVGGGDGGCLRHVLMHDVERVVQVELDEAVVRACAEWLPSLADGALADPRAGLVIGDGLVYLGNVDEPFDAIVVDSTDPVGPAADLISEEFFELASSTLGASGMLAIQTGSPLLMRDELLTVVGRMRGAFPIVATYLVHVPSYPAVVWSITIGSKRHDPREPRRPPPVGARYYTPEVHRAAFALPAYLEPVRTGEAAPRAAAGPVLG